jgi:hydroxyacylglutathione hydrolase
MQIDVLKSQVSDNYFYAVYDDEGRCLLIDPIDADQAIEHVRSNGLSLTTIINTHFHHDHVGGNPSVCRAFPQATLIAGATDGPIIDAMMADAHGPRVARLVGQGDTIGWGSLEAKVLDLPGHTSGHIGLLLGDHLFSGDTIFVAGAGNCRFGGDPGVLYRTFRDVLGRLPGEVVFYPGHDYGVRNAEFVLSIDPEQAEAAAMLNEALEVRDAGRLLLTTLEQEASYNPFLSCAHPRWALCLERSHAHVLQRQRELSETEEEAVFRCLRELRNHW